MANDNDKVGKIVNTGDLAKGHQVRELNEGHQMISHKQAWRGSAQDGKQGNWNINGGRQRDQSSWEQKGRQPVTTQQITVTPSTNRPPDPKPIKND